METSGWQKVNQVLGSLRTCKVGEQCENIVKLPSVFEDYPFPILIDAAFLKLGDVFRECNNNFIRFCILKVVVSSAQHHSKVTGKEIFLRPVLSVMHSNDAVARAITLRVLGVCASMFPEKRNVLHSVVRGLDSYMELERDAALFACKQYAAMSQDVSKTVVSKLDELMNSLSTNETLKVKILDVFESMNYDLETCYRVRELCQGILKDQTTERVTAGCLRTLAQMMLSTLSAARETMDLLVEFAVHEPRKAVRGAAFKCLKQVATVQPNLISEADIAKLAEMAEDSGAEILYTLSCSRVARHTLTPSTLAKLLERLSVVPLPTAILPSFRRRA